MKKIILFATLFISSYVFADNHGKHWSYKGFGSWQKQSGDKGAYKVEVNGMYNEAGLSVAQNYKSSKGEWSFGYEVAKKENGFFDMMRDGDKIGDGYCVSGRRSKTCHYSYTFRGMRVETTVHLMGKRMYRVGSVRGGNHGVIKFKERLRRARHK